MRSILTKVALFTFATLGLITQKVEARNLKSLVQYSANGGYQTNMMPTRLAEVLSLNNATVPV
jgi:hypothetical protein